MVKGLSPMDELDAVVEAVDGAGAGGRRPDDLAGDRVPGARRAAGRARRAAGDRRRRLQAGGRRSLHTVLREICAEIRKTPFKRAAKSWGSAMIDGHHASRRRAVRARRRCRWSCARSRCPRSGPPTCCSQVGAVSVCGSDVHQAYGTHSWPVNVPVALGHEFGGTVAAAGRDVQGLQGRRPRRQRDRRRNLRRRA